MKSNSLLISFQYGKIKKALPPVWFDHMCTRQRMQSTQEDFYKQEVFQSNTGDSLNLVSVKTKQFYALMLDAKKCELGVIYFCVIYFWQEKLNLPQQFNLNHLLKFRFGKLFNNNVKQ